MSHNLSIRSATPDDEAATVALWQNCDLVASYDGHRGWIYYVAADPARRKQGIGRRMTEAAEDWLKKRGIVKVMLLVRETNMPVVDFYQRLGFETIPRVIMQKWLIEKTD